jgi:hypothetical protein
MGLRLSITGVASIAAFGGAVVLVLAFGAVRVVKHALYYEKVDAVVQSAGIFCSVQGLTETTRAALNRIPEWAHEKWFDCRAFDKMIPFASPDVKVNRRPQAMIRFVAPADGREHVGPVALTAEQALPMPVKGAILPVYAHKTDPSLVDPDY